MRTVRLIAALCGLFGLLGFSAEAQTPPTLNILGVSAFEGNPPATTVFGFTVVFSKASGQTTTFDVKTIDGTAIAGQDYRALDSTISVPSGTTSLVIRIPIVVDVRNETDETFSVKLSNPSPDVTITTGTAVGTIRNDDPPPSISINDVSVTEGDNGTTGATFAVSLSAPSGKTLTLNFSTADGTAQAGSDYNATAGTLTFAPGETSKNIVVPINGDLVTELNETFFVNLLNPPPLADATIAKAQGVGTIVNDDPTPSISINNIAVAEGNSGTVGATFAVTLSNPSSQTISVDYSTSDGTATAGTDYIAGSGTVIFNPGETAKNITILVNGDNLNEFDETFFVNLSNSVNSTIANSKGTGTIIDDDAPPSISINNANVTEGNTGTTNATFNITLSVPSSKTISVDYATTDGTASAGSDYVAGTGTLTFNPGETSKSVTVAVNGDMLNEPDETFFVNLSNPANATVANAQGTGTIINDDSPPSISINDVSVTEGNTGTTNATFTVSLSNPSGQTIKVDYSTADGTATVGSDYSASSGTLLFNPGETTKNIVVAVNGDNLFEADETFFVNLTNATNAAILDSLGVGTIINDDPNNHPPIAICKNVSVPATTECSAVASINDGSSDPDGDPIVLTQDPPGPYPLGTTLVTLTVSDGRGGTASCQSTVTVFDNMPPMITAPAEVSTSTGPNATTCGAFVADAILGTATATDNCPGVTISRSGVPAGNLFPVGTTTITYTATDASGNTSTATQNITVLDNTVPVITAPVDVTFSTGPGTSTCGLTVTDAMLGTATATDNCPGVTITRNGVPASNLFPAGTTVVEYIARDASGNESRATQRVTVIENTPPTISAPPDLTLMTGPNATTCGAFVADAMLGNATASDNCPGVTVTRTGVPASNLFLVGTTTITYTATDASGNSASATQRVTILDNTPPTITAPAVLTVFTGPNATTCGAVVSVPPSSATDNCPGVTVTVAGIPAGNLFPVGTTTITYTATDVSGNTSTATQNIIVIDNTVPVITAPADVTFSTGPGASTCGLTVTDAMLGTATATDNCPGVTITRNGVPANNLFPGGTTVVEYVARDASGNESRATQRVTVIENTPPTISAPPDLTLMTGPNATTCGIIVNDATLGTATASDNCPGVTITRTGVPTGNLFPVGTTTVTYTATDASGNTASATQRVTIRDNTLPTITCTANITVVDASGQGFATVNYPAPTASDNCAIASVVSTPPSGSQFPVGTTTVTSSATDVSGNTASCSFTVTVRPAACYTTVIVEGNFVQHGSSNAKKVPISGARVIMLPKSPVQANCNLLNATCVWANLSQVNVAGDPVFTTGADGSVVVYSSAFDPNGWAIYIDLHNAVPVGVNAGAISQGTEQIAVANSDCAPNKRFTTILVSDGSTTTAMTSRQQKFTGSVLEITYPDSVVWNGSEFLYPLIFSSDGDWEVDICGDVPQGYHIVGDPCVQLLLASETKVIFFDVVDFMSPEPTLKLHGRVKHNGKTKQFDADIPGLRKGKGHDKNNGPSEPGQSERLLNLGVPSSYALHEAYPNPFNPSTTIRYDLPQDDYVKLKIFDVTGREIAVLVDGFQQGGQYMVQFNASGLPSGIYLYQISTGKFTQAKKLVLTK